MNETPSPPVITVERGEGIHVHAQVESQAVALRRRPAAVPDPEVPATARRRQFTVEYKRSILDQAEACRDEGAIGVLLRREGLYSSHLTTWRRQREQAEKEALAPKKRGRKSTANPRRDQLQHPQHQKPQLLANVPNQVWSWDITKLLGPVRWTYFYLYVILDIFSSYVVGWMVANRESAELAKRLIAETCQKQKIALDQLTLHADRGASMRSKPVALRLADLGVTKAHSWPHVSDDNPFSESHFKTLKYRPEFPDRFGSIQDARAFCQAFFPWYNRPAHARGPSLRLGRRDHRPTPDCFEPGVRTESRTLRPGASQTAGQTHAVWINPTAVRAASEQEQH